MLHNQAFADARNTRDPAMRSFARNMFEGRFDRDHDRDHRRGFFRGIVIGWGGPVFWPYAYPDFVDYVFWPYGDDTFWPYAYDDVYDGIFGAYAPDATAYGYAPVVGSAGRAVPRGVSTGVAAAGTAQVCSGQASGLTDFPIERIADQVNPTDAQRSLLSNLRDATLKAVDLLKSNCPVDVPSTPTGRLGAMRQRIDTMLQAVQIGAPRLKRSINRSATSRRSASSLSKAPAARRRRTERSSLILRNPAAGRPSRSPICRPSRSSSCCIRIATKRPRSAISTRRTARPRIC